MNMEDSDGEDDENGINYQVKFYFLNCNGTVLGLNGFLS